MPIFDQGYQHWSGQLAGHAWRWLAVARHGVRVGMKNRFLRVATILAWLPAAGLGFILAVWGMVEQKSEYAQFILPILAGLLGPQVYTDPLSIRLEAWTIFYDTFLMLELRLSMILILIAGPGLISQDLRFNALPLYFSRPVRRLDYFLGKLGVIAWFLALVVIVPSLIAYLLGLLFSRDLTIIPDTLPLLLAAVGYGAVMTLSAGTLILALSSLTRNSRYIALFWLAIWFVTSLVAMVLDTVNREHRRFEAFRRNEQARVAAQQPGQPRGPHQPRGRDDWRKIQQEFEAEQQQAELTNWRPMVSYTGNLARVGEHMLGTNAAYQRLAEKLPAEARSEYLQRNLGPRYPWHWSAAVLAALFGISACILNYRVKSLDRLK